MPSYGLTRKTLGPMMSPVSRGTIIFTLMALLASLMFGRAWAGARTDPATPPPIFEGCCGPAGCCCCDPSDGGSCGDEDGPPVVDECEVEFTCCPCARDGTPPEHPDPLPYQGSRVQYTLSPLRPAGSACWAAELLNRSVTDGKIDPRAARLAERPPEPLLEVLCTWVV
jgi:hypothetical protein